MKKFLAKRSVFFHLVMLSLGMDLITKTNREYTNLNSTKTTVPEKIEPRILIVGMSESPHLITWLEGLAVSQIVEKVWIFPSDFPINQIKIDGLRIMKFPYFLFEKSQNYFFRIMDYFTKRLWRSYFLYREINRIMPTHLHFHETQHGAYIYNAIANHPKNRFSGKTILSTWGSDLIVYGKVESHKQRIEQVLSWTDLLTSERPEDFEVAEVNGFRGKFCAPLYITIGNRMDRTALVRPSDRKVVLIKGYQDNHGRALNALASVELLSKELDLSDFQFEIFSAGEAVALKAELMKVENGLTIRVLPRLPKLELIEHFKVARAYIGLAISDGLSTSMVEAMICGAFPIQSKNSSASEFLVSEINGGVVDPWDIQEVCRLLKLALMDDVLVDQAAVINNEKVDLMYNWETGLNRLKSIYF